MVAIIVHSLSRSCCWPLKCYIQKVIKIKSSQQLTAQKGAVWIRPRPISSCICHSLFPKSPVDGATWKRSPLQSLVSFWIGPFTSCKDRKLLIIYLQHNGGDHQAQQPGKSQALSPFVNLTMPLAERGILSANYHPPLPWWHERQAVDLICWL